MRWSRKHPCHARRGRLRAAAGLAVLAPLLVSACSSGGTVRGSGSGGTGKGRTIAVDGYRIKAGGNLRVAFFAPFLGNAAIQQVRKTVASKVAEVPGARLTVLDANGSATRQVNQIQDAVQSRRYNVAFVIAADPVLECTSVTKDMPRAGILVGVFNTPMCGTWNKEGDGLRAPGTFAFIGGTHTIDYYTDYFTWIARRNPGPQKVLVITAPQLNAVAQAIDKALARVHSTFPDFKVVDEAYTDYSVPMSFTKTQTMIQAHPDATILYTGYSTSAQGAVKALRASHRLGTVKIYDKGGSKWAAGAVRQGLIESTTPEAQVTSAGRLMRVLIDGFHGRTGPTVVLHDGIRLLPGATRSGFEAFTKADIDQWKPEVP
jgi:ribose transport system substrate-binding protein